MIGDVSLAIALNDLAVLFLRLVSVWNAVSPLKVYKSGPRRLEGPLASICTERPCSEVLIHVSLPANLWWEVPTDRAFFVMVLQM